MQLDLAGAEKLGEPIEESLRDRSLIVDLSGVDFIDSAGLRVLVAAGRLARRGRHGFAVIGATGRAVKSVLELTKASTQIPLFPSLEAAQASL